MLAGFDDEGVPIVHDPALKSGHAYKHNKTELSQSWFKKGGGIGGVAYTFTLRDSAAVTGIKHLHRAGKSTPADHIQVSNYPNPFNSQTTFVISLNSAGSVQLMIYDLLGRQVTAIPAGYLRAGVHHLPFNMRKVTERKDLSSGLMLYHLYLDGKKVSGGKLLYLK